jgi:hypothetical protein
MDETLDRLFARVADLRVLLEQMAAAGNGGSP